MRGYLGQTLIEPPTINPAELVMLFIEHYGQIDGAHHKAWVIDQAARILKGTPVLFWEARWDDGTTEVRFSTEIDPSPAYMAWVEEMKIVPDDPTDFYLYDEGIAP